MNIALVVAKMAIQWKILSLFREACPQQKNKKQKKQLLLPEFFLNVYFA